MSNEHIARRALNKSSTVSHGLSGDWDPGTFSVQDDNDDNKLGDSETRGRDLQGIE